MTDKPYLSAYDANKVKEFEPTVRFAKGDIIFARLDGRGFSKFTADFIRPFDQRFSNVMQAVTAYLIKEFNAKLAYTQSDEITLVWHIADNSKSDLPFDGRIQKMVSLLAASATGHFINMMNTFLPERKGHQPMFDCRVWSVGKSPTLAIDSLFWREQDCYRNSVSQAVHAFRNLLTSKNLDGINIHDRKQMLMDINIDFERYPADFREGVYFMRNKVSRPFDEEDLAKIPEQHRRNAPEIGDMVVRTVIERAPFSSITKAVNAISIITGD
jgi:tRNA(His) 5'-end guanylyltransferase